MSEMDSHLQTVHIVQHTHTETQITRLYQLWYRVGLVVMLKAQPLGCMLNR